MKYLLLGLAFMLPVTSAADVPLSYQKGGREFTAQMVRKHGFDRREVDALIGKARYQQEIIDAIRRPWEAKPWYRYRPIFLTPERIAAGAEFWRANRDILDRAQREFGVAPAVVVAIIGVETNYGGNLGRHRVIDALTTLGFSYPKRADFFRKELESLLLLARSESIDVTDLKGSYAGAVGMPQFIPSSYRAYAVDFDGDGRRDLWNSRADVIGSVASYLARHGWRPREPVAQRARVRGGVPARIPVAEKKPKKPNIEVSRLRDAGIEPIGPMAGSKRATFVRLEAPEDEYWLGYTNFYVITRYNHSNLYAMAVFQLSQRIEEHYRAGG